MYTKRNTVYADPYKMLQGAHTRAYQVQGRAEDYTEIDCPITDLTISHGMAKWGGGNIVMMLPDNPTYEAIKTKLIKIRYSNDDQLAIMLNADQTDMQRMQQWRDWATDVAKAICKYIGISC